jgi:lactate dehydrogenase-like 2-hydroxyacid dehydrogenase
MSIDQPLVLVSHTLPAGWLDMLDGWCRLLVGPPAETLPGLSPELESHLPEAAGLLTLLTVPVTAALLDKAVQLKVVSNIAVGVDNIDLAACTRRGIPVGHTPGVLTEGTADLTMALLLAVARRIPQAAQDARDGRWTTWSPTGWLGADLNRATLGIVGMGKIGQAVAERARGFGLRLVYANRSARPEVEEKLGAVRLPLTELLGQSDFVSLHVPLTPETRHLIQADTLRQMKPSAILLNVSRGPVVDTAALVHALSEGWIQAAGLDVTDPEPLPPDHPLYQLPNCLVLPHIGSATWNTRRRMAELAAENILAGLAGRPLPYCANRDVYGAGGLG